MYESHFGLLTKPFQLRPDPDFFYSSSGHKRALSYLQYGLTQGEGFIVVTGDIGTGKTTLMRNVLSTIKKENIVASQLVTTKLEADDLLRMICSSFSLPVEGKPKAVLLQQFEDFLKQVHGTGKRVLLIVDEAQNLPSEAIEELRMLSNFQMSDAPLLQSFLLGQPELKGIIQKPSMEQFRQRIIASCHLEPLKKNEVKDYIIWRLTVAGWVKNPSFNEDVFSAIHDLTGGVPRRINIFCDRLLLFCFLEDVFNITLETIQTVADELSEELSSQPEARTPVIPPPFSQRISEKNTDYNDLVSEIEAVHKKIKELDSYLNETLDEKVELLKTIDKKLKQRIRVLMELKSK